MPNDIQAIKRIMQDMKHNPKKYRLIFEAYRKLPDSKRKQLRRLPKAQRKKIKKLI